MLILMKFVILRVIDLSTIKKEEQDEKVWISITGNTTYIDAY